jgi:hypothetical protein
MHLHCWSWALKGSVAQCDCLNKLDKHLATEFIFFWEQLKQQKKKTQFCKNTSKYCSWNSCNQKNNYIRICLGHP